MSTKKFFICRHCGNIIAKVEDSGVSVVCCGDEMEEIIPNIIDASVEKHLPVVKVEGQKVSVSVGDTPHPMWAEHFIQWVFLETDNGGQRRILLPGDAPHVDFFIANDDKPIAVFAYCNLHGLWLTEL